MGAPGFSKDTLTSMRLSQLRELARRLGVGRYSGMLREGLISAILIRGPREEAIETGVPQTQVPSEALSPLEDAAATQIHPPQPVFYPETTSELAAPPNPLVVPQSISHSNDPKPESTNHGSPTWVTLIPLDGQWATVCWGINTTDRARAQAAGGQQLALRITDVTDNTSKQGRPYTLQEVLIDSGSNEWHLPLPLGDRDYRVELGFRTVTGGWVSLVFSQAVWLPASDELPIPSIVPFSLEDISGDIPTAPSQPHPGLHERLYQQASSARQRTRLGSEVFHEQGSLIHGQAAAGGHLSGVGQWASGREASGAGIPARQREFWLVADAELIVYGATDPAATLTVGDQTMPLTIDGTFHLHMPFQDGDQNFPIRALAADGVQQRSITLDFQRNTPHAKVNSKETAVPEWF